MQGGKVLEPIKTAHLATYVKKLKSGKVLGPIKTAYLATYLKNMQSGKVLGPAEATYLATYSKIPQSGKVTRCKYGECALKRQQMRGVETNTVGRSGGDRSRYGKVLVKAIIIGKTMARSPAVAVECRAAEKEGMVPLKEHRRRRNFVDFRQPAPAYPAAGSGK